ncbi:MAG: hypothetical protein H6737_29025 [Alphaproteobacteria bacterium]|nr:hypothetical protein [Alphaproteobacteria bacterium]
MSMLDLLNDCVTRARRIPALLDGPAHLEALEACDTLLADLDVTLVHCLAAIAHGEDMDLVVSQILQLKWLVYTALQKHLTACGWSETALSALACAGECDLRDSRDRLAVARATPVLALAG